MKKAMLCMWILCVVSVSYSLGGTLLVPDEYSTIQAAIFRADHGDLIIVDPGTYDENIDFLGKNLLLISRGGPDLTTIRAAAYASTVAFVNNEGRDALLQGFTIENGRGNWIPGTGHSGGGIYCSASSPTIANNIIRDNSTDLGGGIGCNAGASPVIVSNRICDNSVLYGIASGAGIYCSGSSPIIKSNEIYNNFSEGEAGGIACYDDSEPEIVCNRIYNNEASAGGAMFCSSSDPTIRFNSMFGNYASSTGGCMRCFWSSPLIENNNIYENRTPWSAGSGGAFYLDSSSHPRMINNLIYFNCTGGNGGGVYSYASSPTLINNTFYVNRAGEKGGAYYGSGNSYPVIVNSVFWDNLSVEDPEIYCYTGGEQVTFCNIKGGYTGNGNIDSDPLFVAPRSRDFRLMQPPCQSGGVSPCVDAGDPAYTDHAGSTRSDGRIDTGLRDMGYHYPRALHVPDEFGYIQDALDEADHEDTILVEPGEYLELIDFLGKNVHLRSDADGDLTTYDPVPLDTVINGGGDGPVVRFETNEGSGAILEGFRIINGFNGYDTGGIVCRGSSPLITKNSLSDNQGLLAGGLFIEYAYPEVRDNVFSGNTSGIFGGGIHLYGSSALIEDNIFHFNTARRGGGVNAYIGMPSINNNLFHLNYGLELGGGLYCENMVNEISNNTFYINVAYDSGGALYHNVGDLVVSNSIFWDNTADTNPEIHDESGELQVIYCDVKGGWTGPGNIDSDPLFVSASNLNFRLRQDPCQPGTMSPCVDSGYAASGLIRGTTRTDEVQDKDIMDMGYHYPIDSVLNVPEDFITIQQAIEFAEEGETVLVAPGTYYETVDFMGKGITLKSEDGAESTVINALLQGSCVSFTSSESADSMLDGFTVTKGTGTAVVHGGMEYFGGGVFISDFASPCIINNIITDNTALDGGAGIYCEESMALIESNLICGNETEFGYGGGIHCTGSSALIEKNIIAGNDGIWGAGIFCTDSYDQVSFPLIRNNEIHENGLNSSPPSRGAGIYCKDCTPWIEGNYIHGNESQSGGGIECLDVVNGVIQGNRIMDNQATTSSGGGINVKGDCDFRISDNMIVNNIADYGGGGIAISSSDMELVNNTFINNYAGTYGGALYLGYESAVLVANSILWDNLATFGLEIAISDEYYPSELSLFHSDVEGGQPSVFVKPNCILNWGAGMIDADPLFVDAVNSDTHLTYLSPCLNAGENTHVMTDEDFEDDPRVAGGTVDMGADEFHTHLYCTGDFTPGGAIEGKFVDLPGTAPVGLFIGSGLLETPLQHKWGDFHLDAPWLLIPLVPIPSNGVLTLGTAIPATPVAPYDIPMQALFGTTLSNLFVLEVR